MEKKTNIRKLSSKKFKLLDDIEPNSIEISIEVKYNLENERQRKIIISKLRGNSKEVIHTYEFFCEDLKDLHIIEKHLIDLSAGNNILRCINWITNKLQLRID